MFLIIKFLYSVKPTQRHDDIIISTRSLFRKLFSFLYSHYLIPKRGHHNVVISTKSLFRIISNSNTLIISRLLLLSLLLLLLLLSMLLLVSLVVVVLPVADQGEPPYF